MFSEALQHLEIRMNFKLKIVRDEKKIAFLRLVLGSFLPYSTKVVPGHGILKENFQVGHNLLSV